MPAKETAAFLNSIEAESLEHLREMVSINSFTLNRQGALQNADYCTRLFEPLGFKARRVPSVNPLAGDHLFLSRAGSGAGNLLLVAHLDTVFPVEQEKQDGHVWRQEGDRLYGPGTADMKGGIVLIHMVLRALQKSSPQLFDSLSWDILINGTEETGCSDFPVLATSYVRPGTLACLVFEAGFKAEGGSSICMARKGSGGFRIEVEGKGAHSGENHPEGASAVREMARLIERIESLTDYSKGLTFNVGQVEGGTVVNAVPSRAWAMIDMRAITREEYDRGRALVQAMAGEGTVRSAEGGFTCRVKVTDVPRYPPWPESESSRALAECYHEAAQGLGLVLKPRLAGGASDANHFAGLVPVIDEVGPLGAHIHCSVHRPEAGQEQEYAYKSSFVERALLNVEAIHRIAVGGGKI